MNNASVTPQPVDSESIRKSNKQKLVWGLICLLGPTALLVVSLLLYAIINFIFAATSPVVPANCPPSGADSIMMGACATENIDQTGATGAQGPLKVILNVTLFLVGAVATLTWLPGIIGGIILLATRTRNVPHQ